MDGAELQLLGEYLPDDLRETVDITGTSCLDCCDKEQSQRAPFVEIAGKITPNASIAKIVSKLREIKKGNE